MSAETLRRAASLMRERAEAAPESRWVTRPASHGDHADGPTLMVVENQRGLISEHDYDKWGGTSAEHIASWHPDVALAVADLLDVIREDVGTSSLAYHAATDLARTYLGESA